MKNFDFEELAAYAKDKSGRLVSGKIDEWLKKRKKYKKHHEEVYQVLRSLGHDIALSVKWSKDAMDDFNAAGFDIPLIVDGWITESDLRDQLDNVPEINIIIVESEFR